MPAEIRSKGFLWLCKCCTSGHCAHLLQQPQSVLLPLCHLPSDSTHGFAGGRGWRGGSWMQDPRAAGGLFPAGGSAKAGKAGAARAPCAAPRGNAGGIATAGARPLEGNVALLTRLVGSDFAAFLSIYFILFLEEIYKMYALPFNHLFCAFHRRKIKT